MNVAESLGRARKKTKNGKSAFGNHAALVHLTEPMFAPLQPLQVGYAYGCCMFTPTGMCRARRM